MDAWEWKRINDGEYGDVAPLLSTLEQFFGESPDHKIVGWHFHGTDAGNQPAVGIMVEDATGKWRTVMVQDSWDWTLPGRKPGKKSVKKVREKLGLK